MGLLLCVLWLKVLPNVSCRGMRCMPIVPPTKKVISLMHEAAIEIVNRVHLQPDNIGFCAV